MNTKKVNALIKRVYALSCEERKAFWEEFGFYEDDKEEVSK